LQPVEGRGKLQSMGVYLRVKICGVTNEADAIQAGLLGADAIGLNFYKGSPRYITPTKAESILQQGMFPFVEPIGIFVSFDMRSDLKIISNLKLRTAQLHEADENSSLTFLSNSLGIGLISAFSVGAKNDLERINRFMEKCEQNAHKLMARGEENAWRRPVAVLVDARVPGEFGGTGKTVPWELLADYKGRVPLILAGGLTPENVGEAVRIVRPYAVDVASGVESSPGQKDPEKMKRFIENAREAAER
jgi:phosphoribosylanthranilate isomerase